MTAALASGSAPLPSLPQPWARALPLLLGSGPSPFEAIRQPSSGRTKAEDLRPKPLTGSGGLPALLPALTDVHRLLTLTLTLTLTPTLTLTRRSRTGGSTGRDPTFAAAKEPLQGLALEHPQAG